MRLREETWLLHFCPHFVVEIMSGNDRPAAARRKMEEIYRPRRATGMAH